VQDRKRKIRTDLLFLRFRERGGDGRKMAGLRKRPFGANVFRGNYSGKLAVRNHKASQFRGTNNQQEDPETSDEKRSQNR